MGKYQKHLYNREYKLIPGCPNDIETSTQKSRMINRYKRDREDCDEDYTNESARTFGERLKGHLRVPYAIYDHAITTAHLTSVDSFSIVGREP